MHLGVCGINHLALIVDGRIRIVDQNSGTRGIAETPSSAPVVSVSIRDGSNSHEYLLVLDKSHDITIWDINQWQVDSSDVPYIVHVYSSDIDLTISSDFRQPEQSQMNPSHRLQNGVLDTTTVSPFALVWQFTSTILVIKY